MQHLSLTIAKKLLWGHLFSIEELESTMNFKALESADELRKIQEKTDSALRIKHIQIPGTNAAVYCDLLTPIG